MSEGEDIWFHYRDSPGQFRGWPVNVKGWVALIAVVLAPQALLWSLVGVFHPQGVWAPLIFLLVVLPVTLLAAVKLVKSKGLRI